MDFLCSFVVPAVRWAHHCSRPWSTEMQVVRASSPQNAFGRKCLERLCVLAAGHERGFTDPMALDS